MANGVGWVRVLGLKRGIERAKVSGGWVMVVSE